jgi:tetratricopeptide (TPR) repeat protein
MLEVLYFGTVGKASRKKKKVGKIAESGRAKSEDERIGLASKVTPPRLVIIAVLVAIVTFSVFLPALQNEFVDWDDNLYVYDNSFIHSIDAKLFKSAFFSFTASNWHPLTWISHAVDYAIWGLNPMGHHLTNIILHALNTFVVVLLVMRLIEAFKKTGANNNLSRSLLNDRAILIAGASTGLLFGLHPLHVESVAWVSERKDLLCALFFLLSIIMYTKYISFPDNEIAQQDSVSRFFNKQYLLAIGFFFLALLSKPMAVTLPLVLLILDWYPFERIQSPKTFWAVLVEKLPFIVLSLISSILTILAQKAGGSLGAMKITSLSTRMLVAAKSLVVYLWHMIFPLNLVPFYPYPNPKNWSLLSLESLFSIIFVVGITIISVAIAKKHKLWLTAWGYYVVTLLPVLGIVQVGGQSMADRYTYLPSLGPFLVMGLIAATIYEKVINLKQWRLTLKMASFVVAIAVLTSISYATIQQIGVWKNSVVLWNYVIKKEPGVNFAHLNLGLAYKSKGLIDMAIEQYQTVLRLRPDYAEAYYDLGSLYKSKGLIDMAIEQYQTVLRLRPDYAEAHNNLGILYKSKGLIDMAIEQYQTALRLRPDYAEAHNNLGIAYQSKGLIDMAIEQYQTALRLRPDDAEPHNNLGFAYQSKGLIDMAIEQYQTALRLKPDYAEARYNLGFAYIKRGLKNNAIRELRAALQIRPDLIGAREAIESLTR